MEKLKANKKTEITLETLFFDLYFGLMLLVKGLGFTAGPVYKGGILLAMAFVCLKILIGRYNTLQKILILLLGLLGILCWRTSEDYAVIFCLSLVLSMKNIDKKHAFRVGAGVWSAAFVISLLTQLLNLRTRDFKIHSKFGLGYLIRWALGYSHPNVLQIAYTVLVFYGIYLVRRDSSKKLIHDKRAMSAILLSFVGALYIFLYSLSTTGLLMYLIYLFVLLYMEARRDAGRSTTKAGRVFLIVFFPICVLLSVLGPLLIQGRAFDLLNSVMNTRPSLSRYYLTEYGISLFGRTFPDVPASITLDCSYVNLLIYNGLIIFLVMCIGYVLLMRHEAGQEASWEHSNEIAILISVIAAAMSEPFAFNTSFKNVSLIFLGYWFYQATAKYGRESAWIALLAPVGERKVALPGGKDAVKQKFRAGCGAVKEHRKTALLLSLVVMMTAAALCLLLTHFPGKVIARRISCDTDDSMVNVYYTEEEIDALRADPEIWVLDYKDETDPMLIFDNPNMIRMEKVRAVVSACVWSGAAVILLMGIVMGSRKSLRGSGREGQQE